MRIRTKSTVLAALFAAIFPLLLLAEQTTQIDVKVDGMVCGSCVQAIKKSFLEHDSIESTKVSLSTDQATLTLKQGMEIEDDQIRAIIKEAGYQPGEIARKKLNSAEDN